MAKPLSTQMRILHRYLGYFLAGIMAVYALSGVVMIFRDTDFLKRETHYERVIEKNLDASAVGREIRSRDLKFTNVIKDTAYFKNGSYIPATGAISYNTKELPAGIQKLTQLHKANSKHPLFWMNIFFGVSLLFFVVSAFFMFAVKSRIFNKAMYWTIAGFVLTIVILFLV